MLALLSGCVFLPSFWLKLNCIPVFIVFATWKHVCFQTWDEPGTLHLASSPWWSQFNSVHQLCPTLCDPMDCSTPGLPVHHQHLEFTQTHVHWVGDAVQPSHPLLSPSSPTFNLSQHQGLFKWVGSHLAISFGQSIGVSASTSVLPMNIQDWFPLGWTGWISLQSKGLSRVFWWSSG